MQSFDLIKINKKTVFKFRYSNGNNELLNAIVKPNRLILNIVVYEWYCVAKNINLFLTLKYTNFQCDECHKWFFLCVFGIVIIFKS